MNDPAPRVRGIIGKSKTVILRLDRGIHFFSLDCPIKLALNCDRVSDNEKDRALRRHQT